MATDVTMPQLGESVTEGTITKWLKKPGDKIAKYEPLCEVNTDKVNAEVPATVEGVLKEILISEGHTVEVGTVICRIETSGSASVEAPGETVAPQQANAPVSADKDKSMKNRYSPAVLRLAQEHGIDLETVEGTGRGGRITRKDILRYLEKGPKEKVSTPVETPAPAEAASVTETPVVASVPPAVQVPTTQAPPPIAIEPGDKTVPVSSVRRTIAQRMVTSKHEAPHAWTMVEVDVTGLVQLRERLKDEFKQREGISLTYLPFAIKAVADTLKEFPYLNAVWGGDSIV